MLLSDALYAIGQWSGYFALVCLGFLIFSGDIARFADRFLGLDRIIKFQRKFSFFVAALVVLHPLFFILAGQSFVRFFVPSFTALPLALGSLAFYIFAAVMIFSHYYKLISYKSWQYIHVLTYALFFFALYHAFFWGSDSQSALFLTTYIVLLAAVLIGIIYRTSYKLRELKNSTGTAVTVVWESADTYTITIRLKKTMKFKAGQFCFLRLNQDKLYARHPFTISSDPGESDLRFTVKNTGRFTAALAKLKTGDKVHIDGPFGRFTEREKAKSFIFIAGGVGITPFRSLIRDIVSRTDHQPVSLIYFAKQEKDLIFKNEFDAITSQSFKTMYFTSESETNISLLRHGRLTRNVVEEAMLGLNEPTFYICGPEKIKQAASSILKELTIPRSRIIIEDFFW